MVGIGYDLHILVKNAKLIIGGIVVDSDIGTIAHSDGDVLIHALVDALLGAAGLGDIGEYFPDTDEKFKNADSKVFLNSTIDLISKHNLKISNIDAVIILEKPKLRNFKNQIKDNLAKLCNINSNQINIKAKTNEKLGYIGNSEAIACLCICELVNIQ